MPRLTHDAAHGIPYGVAHCIAHAEAAVMAAPRQGLTPTRPGRQTDPGHLRLGFHENVKCKLDVSILTAPSPISCTPPGRPNRNNNQAPRCKN